MTFAKRLEAAKKAGRLTTADLAVWFGRPYPTVRGWLVRGYKPWGPHGEESTRLLDVLERAIAKRHKLPVPVHLAQSARISWVKELRHDLDRRVPKTHSAA